VTRRLIASAIALALAAAGAACTGDTTDEPTTAPTSPAGAVVTDLTIAFVVDLSQDGAAQRVAPAFQGARLAVDSAGLRDASGATVQVVPLDTEGTPAGIQDVADRIVGDPTVVAAIVAPQLTGQIALGDRLDAAGVPTISLSTLGPLLPDQGWAWWRRAVPDVEREARTLVASVRGIVGPRRTCLLGDGSAASVGLLRAVRAALTVRPALRLGLGDTDPDDAIVVAAIREARCRSVVWGGTPAGGALLRLALVDVGLRAVRLFGGESLKDASFITTAGPRGRGTVAVCPCVDLSTSTDLRAQRFIQDYQSAFGVPPGPFAAEAWDVTGMLLDAVASGATDRGAIADVLSRTSTFDGLARAYAFSTDGVLEDPAAAVLVYRDEGVRWVSRDASSTR
jgi:ABC-type branched-subunit amino acid transport system substrate-binding protein